MSETTKLVIIAEDLKDTSENLTVLDVTVQEVALKGLKVYLMERDVLDLEFDVLSKQEVTAENIHKFKELRLKYVRNRTQGTNKWHEKESEVSLRYKQFLDAKKRAENSINESREEKLLGGEKFFENIEKERISTLQKERVTLISEYLEDTTGLDLGNMPNEVFEGFFNLKKTQKLERIEADNIAEQKIFAEEKAETERLQLKAIEDEKIRKENAKLKANAEANELALKKEREENERKANEEKANQDAILANEKAKSEKLALALKAKQDAELTAENERLAIIEIDRIEKDKLAKAPIKKQLLVWVECFEISLPQTSNKVTLEISQTFNAFKSWAKSEIDKI